MEEAKAAAYFDELTRKGEGAARFKQGLGFSSSSSSSSIPFPSKPSSSSSFLFSKFVRSTSPGKATKQAQLETIQAKLRHRSRERDDRPRRRSSSRERRKERDRDRRSRSRDRRRRSRSYSEEEVEDGRFRDRRSPSRTSSGGDFEKDRRREECRSRHRKGDALDYARLIEGYSQMTPAERVKAKMKLQLSQTAAKDSTLGMSSGWERFDFNKDAPLDDYNDEIEVAEDDASLVKEIGNSFRFSAVQAKREEQIKAAHDEAMFGASAMAPTVPESEISRGAEKNNNENQDNNLLISDKVLAMQPGSWRDRAGRFKRGLD